MKAIWVSAALLAVVPCFGQTAAELLQKGVYAQETEGNLDNAILIYRQIVNSAPSQRDVAAQAQYRLAQALLQKGNLTEASREFERLARDYADYGSLVSSLAGQIQPGTFRFNVTQAPALQRAARVAELQAKLADLRTKYTPEDPEVKRVEAQIQDLKKALAQTNQVDLFSGEFDMAKTTLFTGKVSQVQWINPRAWLTVETSGGTYRVQLAAPNTMVRSGMNRNTFQLEMEVTVTGALAKDGSMTVQAATILSGGTPIFSRATLAPVPDAQ
jgi:tetratricopeptide (TPR) repeat protein